jgi:hypothetical protein
MEPSERLAEGAYNTPPRRATIAKECGDNFGDNRTRQSAASSGAQSGGWRPRHRKSRQLAGLWAGTNTPRALILVGVGTALGSLAAWMLTRALAALFLGVSPHDPAIFVGAAAVFGLVALSAASIPSFRTTRVSPVVALTST